MCLLPPNANGSYSQLDSEQFAAVYATGDQKFHEAIGEPEFVKLLDSVHRKLGNVRQSALRNTGIVWSTGQGATVTLVYETKFAEGSGVENFVWRIKDGGAALYGYHINSNELVSK